MCLHIKFRMPNFSGSSVTARIKFKIDVKSSQINIEMILEQLNDFAGLCNS
jgi:hypothetical protein